MKPILVCLAAAVRGGLNAGECPAWMAWKGRMRWCGALAEFRHLQSIDAGTFLAHLNQRAGYYHDQSLTGMETTSPGFAARFDTRADSEIPDGGMYPPMFMGDESDE